MSAGNIYCMGNVAGKNRAGMGEIRGLHAGLGLGSVLGEGLEPCTFTPMNYCIPPESAFALANFRVANAENDAQTT